MDQHLLIVGGSSGIGFAVAEAAVDAGARVTIASRDAAKVAAAAQSLGGETRGETVDVLDEASIRALFDRLEAIDHLVVTVGLDHPALPVTASDAAVVTALLQAKFLGQYLTAKHAAARLDERGSITLTSGVLGRRPAADWAALSAVNAALDALGKALALELAPRRVNVVSPGLVDTGKRFAGDPARLATLQATFGDKLPLRRVGQPHDLAQAYLFAIQNPYLTGQTLVIDGGQAIA